MLRMAPKRNATRPAFVLSNFREPLSRRSNASPRISRPIALSCRANSKRSAQFLSRYQSASDSSSTAASISAGVAARSSRTGFAVFFMGDGIRVLPLDWLSSLGYRTCRKHRDPPLQGRVSESTRWGGRSGSPPPPRSPHTANAELRRGGFSPPAARESPSAAAENLVEGLGVYANVADDANPACCDSSGASAAAGPRQDCDKIAITCRNCPISQRIPHNLKKSLDQLNVPLNQHLEMRGRLLSSSCVDLLDTVK